MRSSLAKKSLELGWDGSDVNDFCPMQLEHDLRTVKTKNVDDSLEHDLVWPKRDKFLNEFNLIAFQSQTCQPAGRVSARVDVDTVVPHVWFPDRGVAVDDKFFKRLFVQ
jgi:hypothetical protein